MSRQRMSTLVRALLPSLAVLSLSLALIQVDGIDFFMHFLGGLAVAWGAFIIVKDMMARKKLPASLPEWMQAYIAFGTTAVVGIVWEFHEWAEDYYFLTGRQPDLTDTMNDLLMDLLGAVFILLILDLDRKRKRR